MTADRVNEIKAEIRKVLETEDHDYGTYAPLLIRLGWHCSATYAPQKKLVGGSNGTGICHAPEKDDVENKGLEVGVALLKKIHEKFAADISFSDLVILASYVSLEETDGPIIEFRLGRRDIRVNKSASKTEPGEEVVENGRLPVADYGIEKGVEVSEKKEREEKLEIVLDSNGRLKGWQYLSAHIKQVFHRMGFTNREIVALIAGGHVYGKCHRRNSGFEGAWVTEPRNFSNEYCLHLSRDTFVPITAHTLIENQPVPDEVRPASARIQYMKEWTPSMERQKQATFEAEKLGAAVSTTYFPGNYVVRSNYVNVRKTENPESDLIDQIKEGVAFDVLHVREYGENRIRGFISFGGWVSIVNKRGHNLLERTGDVQLEPEKQGPRLTLERYRYLDYTVLKPRFYARQKTVGEEIFNQVVSDVTIEKGQVVNIIQVRTDSGRNFYGELQGSPETWILLVDGMNGPSFEKVVQNYNETIRKSIEKYKIKHQMMTPADMVMIWDEDFKPYIMEFAENEPKFKQAFAAAFKKLTENGCAFD